MHKKKQFLHKKFIILLITLKKAHSKNIKRRNNKKLSFWAGTVLSYFCGPFLMDHNKSIILYRRSFATYDATIFCHFTINRKRLLLYSVLTNDASSLILTRSNCEVFLYIVYLSETTNIQTNIPKDILVSTFCKVKKS